MKFGMPSKRVLLKALYFLLLAGILLGIAALFIGVINITLYEYNSSRGGTVVVNKNGSYFEYLKLKKYYSNIVSNLNNQGMTTDFMYSYTPFARTTNTSPYNTGYISVPGILPDPNPGSSTSRNSSGILPTPALGPGPVLPSSGSLAAHNA